MASGKRPPAIIWHKVTNTDSTKFWKKTGWTHDFFANFTCFCSISIFLSKHKTENVDKYKFWNLWFPTRFLYLRIQLQLFAKNGKFVIFYKIYLQIWRQINVFCKKLFLFSWLTVGEFSCFSFITLMILLISNEWAVSKEMIFHSFLVVPCIYHSQRVILNFTKTVINVVS